jgi:hypothetical protein
VCDRQGLIGREMFAIDGVKLPSNASKAKSGTRADYRRQLEKMEKAANKLLAQHRQADAVPPEPDAQHQTRKLERLQKEAQQLRDWLQIGSVGLFYCVEEKTFTTPFLVVGQPVLNGGISNVWPGTWKLPFDIVPFGSHTSNCLFRRLAPGFRALLAANPGRTCSTTSRLPCSPHPNFNGRIGLLSYLNLPIADGGYNDVHSSLTLGSTSV